MNKYYCYSPYIVRNITKNQLIPCCKALLHKNNSDLITVEEMKEMFIQNKIPLECENCNVKLHINNHSINDVYNENIKRLEIQLGRLCNARCRICFLSNDYSNIENHKLDKSLYESIINKHKDTIEFVNLYGGETFLYEKEIIDVLSLLNKDTFIHLHTNGTIINKNIINKLLEFNKIDLKISIDGTNETNHLTRNNCDIVKILEFIDYFKSIDAFNKLRVNVTISTLNIFNLNETINYIKSLGFSNENICLNFVTNYDIYFIGNLYPEEKLKLYNKITKDKDLLDVIKEKDEFKLLLTLIKEPFWKISEMERNRRDVIRYKLTEEIKNFNIKFNIEENDISNLYKMLDIKL